MRPADPRKSVASTYGVLLRTIDLATLRAHLGERFKSVSDRIHAVLQKDLKQELAGSGWFWPVGDFCYLVVSWSLTEDGIDEAMQRVTTQLRSHLKSLNIDTAGLMIPVNSAHLDLRGRVHSDEVQSVDAETEMDKQEAAASEAPRYVFEPVWNVGKGLVSAFRVVRIDDGPSGLLTVGDTLTEESEERERQGAADRDRLVHVIAEWSRLAGGTVCLVIVPVQFETLTSSGLRRAFLEVCRGIPLSLRRLLIFEIEHLPKGVMASRIVDVLRYLKSCCRAVICRVGVNFEEFATLQKAGIPVVSCDVRGRANEAQLLQTMDRFVEAAEKYKLQAGIYGIRSVSLTTAASAAGFAYIGGEAIHDLAEAPKTAFRFEIPDVYRDIPEPRQTGLQPEA